MNKLYTLALLVLGFAGYSQAQLSCGDTYTDSGGASGTYSEDENDTVTVCPTIPGQVVVATFTSFSTEEGYDSLTIYNGNSAMDMMIGSYNGTMSPGTVFSTNPNGCLTFVWASDVSLTYDGWEADIMCSDPITCFAPTDVMTIDSDVTTATIGWTASGSEMEWAVEYGPAGFAPGTGTEVITSSNPVTLNGLQGTMHYDYYVRAICGAADTSFAAGPVMFTTDIAPFTCGNIFIDAGGFEDYEAEFADTVTICPTVMGEVVLLDFTMFSVEEGYDSLMIYNGNSINDQLIGTYTGQLDPFTVYSTNANGCLTAMFWSDEIFPDAGWEANINCIAPITCTEPTNLMVDETTEMTATLSWTSTGTETDWVIEYGPAGFEEGTGTVVSANSNPYTISGLTGVTSYDYYVRAYCGGTDTSFTSGPANFMTTPAPFICGNVFVDMGGENGEYSNYAADTMVICPTLPTEAIMLDFSLFSTEEGYDTLFIYNGNSVNDPLIAFYNGDLDPFTVYSTSPTGCLTAVFHSDLSATYDGWLADITCIPAITCFAPTNLMAAATNNSASLSWTSNGSETEWTIEYGPAGFAQGSGTVVTAGTNPFTINGLDVYTEYDYYIKSNCGPGDTSFIAGPMTFMTLPNPTDCGGMFYDNGGDAGEYADDSYDVTVFCPTAGSEFVEVTFTSFETEDGYDSLMIFDGMGMGTLMGTYQGDVSPEVVTSTAPDGCLTFVFVSDGSATYAGWEAEVACASIVSVEENALEVVTVYPNPSTGKFTIENTSGSTMTYEVNDMQGRNVKAKVSTNASESTIDLTNSQNGVYFLVVSNGTSTKTYSLVKN